jgi:DNA polymerase-4
MARETAEWLIRRDLMARTVTIKVRYGDFTTITRSHSAPPTRDADDIARRAVSLLAKTEAGRRPVRLLGAGVHNLVGQVDLDEESYRWPLFHIADKMEP